MSTRLAPTTRRAAIALALLFLNTAVPMTQAGEPTTRDADSPGAAADAFHAAVARGDAAAVEARVAATNADEALLRPGLAGAAAAVGAYDAAMAARFGPTAAAGRWGVASRPSTAPAGDLDAVRENGAWRVTFAGVRLAMLARGVDFAVPADEPMRRLVEMRDALAAVTAEVRAGAHANADAAAEAARRAWHDAARGANAQ